MLAQSPRSMAAATWRRYEEMLSRRIGKFLATIARRNAAGYGWRAVCCRFVYQPVGSYSARECRTLHQKRGEYPDGSLVALQHASQLSLNPRRTAIDDVDPPAGGAVDRLIARFPEAVVDLHAVREIAGDRPPRLDRDLDIRVHVQVDIRKRVGFARPSDPASAMAVTCGKTEKRAAIDSARGPAGCTYFWPSGGAET